MPLFRRKKSVQKEVVPLEKVNPDEVEYVPHKNQIIKARVVDVYDGDTCTVIFGYGFSHLKLKIRVLGVDTPEVKVKGYDRDDPEEVKMANLEEEAGTFVAEKVRELIDQKTLHIRITKWDKFGGRVNGDVFVDTLIKGADVGYTLADYLLENNYAKPYSGRGKKEEWTENQLTRILDGK